MQHAARRETVAQAPDQVVREAALGRADGIAVPLGRLEIVDRDEGRLTPHGEPHVVALQIPVDLLAEPVERRPGLVREGQGDAGRLGDARDLHDVVEGRLARIDAPRDRGGRPVVWRAGQRDMALAAEQARGGVEPDPAGTRQEDLGPGVQVGEIDARAERPFGGIDVGLELNQVARHEARREPEVAHKVDQQPPRVPAGARAVLQRLLGSLRARLHADQVLHRALDPDVELHQEIDRALGTLGQRVKEGLHLGTGGLGHEIGGEILACVIVVDEGEARGARLDEEVEGIDDRKIGREVDLDAEPGRLFGENQPGQPVAARVLLPVDEVVFWQDLQRIAQDLGAAVRGRPQADRLGPEVDCAVVGVVGDVVDGGADRHQGPLAFRQPRGGGTQGARPPRSAGSGS